MLCEVLIVPLGAICGSITDKEGLSVTLYILEHLLVEACLFGFLLGV